MESLPSMWRTELWHPLVVHFPIALLLVGTLFRLGGGATVFAGASRFAFLRPAGRALLVLGTVGAWGAVYTGSLADAIVVRSLCDPTVLESHESLAYRAAYLFSGCVAADVALLAARRWLVSGPEPSRASFRGTGLLRRGLLLAVLGLALAGSATLTYVGHLGSKLVYQQAAAVNQPADDCAAFE